MRVLLFLQLSNFSISIIHYHQRPISNFALSKLEPGTDFFSHPSLDILHNLEAAESGKCAACVVSFLFFPSIPSSIKVCWDMSEMIPSSM